MPRRMQPSYGELYRAIEKSQMLLADVVQMRMSAPARDRLLMLMSSQARLLYRGDGRRRPSATPVEAPGSLRIS